MITMARRTGAVRPENLNGQAPSPANRTVHEKPRIRRYWVARSATQQPRLDREATLNGNGTAEPASPPIVLSTDREVTAAKIGDENRTRGVEVRVHGIGDHATYSALGKPNYKQLVDSRVWIGRVPDLPPHKLRLVNWSRASRQITRHFNWYVAFPFTLLNVAGFMEPKEKVPRCVMRLAVGVASICLTVAMAAWITAIIETAWRAFNTSEDRLTAVILQALGPSILILFMVYRLVVGRALVDRGGALISMASIAALVGMILVLHTRPASYFDRRVSRSGGPNLFDPMTPIVAVTTGVVGFIAVVFAIYAVDQRRKRAGFAGAALLLVLAVALLHAAGSMLRLFTQTLLSFRPPTSGVARVLLPKADDLQFPPGLQSVAREPLRIDLIPIFFLVMVVIFAGLIWLEVKRERKIDNRRKSRVASRRRGSQAPLHSTNGHRGPKPAPKNGARTRTESRPVSRSHSLVQQLPEYLAPAVGIGVIATASVWIGLIHGFSQASPDVIEGFLIGLMIIGGVAIVLIIIRRPEELAERLRRIFGSIADIAGFWAPDLHPLAGASYRRALLSGIRQAINDLVLDYDEPIALVGHSQGSVVCAWFVRGGHWTERQTEGKTDRQALKEKLYDLEQKPSNRIALFTCGSPLDSLYRSFFPRYFDDHFFERTRCMTYEGSHWRNYWRKTDPIGTRLPIPAKDNVDVTELREEETRGHGEYWREPRLRADITGFLVTAKVKRSEELTTSSIS